MNERIARLRQASLSATPHISTERAELCTQFYKEVYRGNESKPVERALLHAYILASKEIYIGEDELIVGERGPRPMAAPTFPEICLHSEKDLEILDQREKISFQVSETVRDEYLNEIIPFWRGKTIRERIFAEMDEDWLLAYDAGVFTEFMEQRGPGHTVLDDKIYRFGMLDFIALIDTHIDQLDFLHDSEAFNKQEQLKAMRITAEGLIWYARRYAEKAAAMAEQTLDPQRKKELLEIARICRTVPALKPETFHEALQAYWFVHVGVITELNPWDAFNPGHLDRHLLPFYEKEQSAGKLSRERALELLECLWVKFNNQPAPPKIGVTAEESNTYTDFANINIGGISADGKDAVNEVSYLLLDVIEEMRLLQPSSNIQLSKKNPQAFLKRAMQIIKTGFGQPSIFNADVVVAEMLRMGKSVADARNGGISGCVETGAFGKENYNLTGYFNLVKILELTLHNGLDPHIQKQVGLQSGEAASFTDFEDLWKAFLTQLNYFIDIKIRGNQKIERLYATFLPVPFLSLLIDDCIATGKDYHNGGARYNTSYIQGVGIGSITDMLTAIHAHVYEQGTISMVDMQKMLACNFDGYEKERQILINRTPKYGNDDERADEFLKLVFEAFYQAVQGRSNTKGGQYEINLLPTTVHIYFGSLIGAMPDGRKAGQPLSEGISPVQGADRNGPTAVLRSAAKIDHIRTGGTLLNQKFTPQLLQDDTGLDKVAQLVRTYFRMDGHHIQFNVVDADTMRKAQDNPDEYRDLIVRVAGYSDYFCNLGKTLQDEIIARTEHEYI
ncbi:MAG: glycyl radical protein [Anaerolineaceae bacterium]|nr:glycyl radical protein [Anaerolineaceae bacterium]